MAFLSLIPAVGSAIIWVPAAVFFFATGAVWKGLFLVGFFVVIVGLVDNILRPLLVGKDTKMPDYLILIATLGGMEIYGINGFVIGPVIAALFIACWNLLSGRDNRENIEVIDEEVIEEGKKQSETAAEAAAEAAAVAAEAAADAEMKVSALAAAEKEKAAASKA